MTITQYGFVTPVVCVVERLYSSIQEDSVELWVTFQPRRCRDLM